MRAIRGLFFLPLAAGLTFGAPPVPSPEGGPRTPAPSGPASAPDVGGAGETAGGPRGDHSAGPIFERRILPIFEAARPSSCTECHLSGVELADYIRPTQEATFAALVAGGLVDVETPDQSKILEFIRRSPEKPSLVSQKVRDEELAAFSAWIEAAARDPALRAARPPAGPIGPALPAEVIRHARADRVLTSFVDRVWTEVGRCAACHSPDKNAKQVAEHGDRVSWIVPRDPRGTLDRMLAAGLIDVGHPERSPLLTKPTLQVEHGGGQKAAVGDRTYKQFRAFLDDYAATAAGKYRTAGELPRPDDEASVVSEIWLKVEGVPEAFDRRLMQVDLYRRTDGRWTEHRVATSDRPVFGQGRLWQHSLSLTAPRGSEEAGRLDAGRLAPGRYLAKLYVDRAGRLAEDFRAELGEGDLVGTVEFEGRWPVGYGQMTVIRFPAP